MFRQESEGDDRSTELEAERARVAGVHPEGAEHVPEVQSRECDPHFDLALPRGLPLRRLERQGVEHAARADRETPRPPAVRHGVHPDETRLSVYDALGREVVVLHAGPLGAGAHAFRLSGSRLPSGAYLVRLVAGGTVETRRVTLVR